MFKVNIRCLCSTVICMIWFGVELCKSQEERIIGGHTCTDFKHEFAVAIFGSNSRFECTGTLLNARWVLSAGHCCVYGIRYILAGISTNNISDVLPKEATLATNRECRFSEGYDPVFSKNDLAVLKLDKDINEGPTVKYVQLPKEALGEDLHGSVDVGIVLGWGAMTENTTVGATQLQCAILYVLPISKCMDIYDTISQKDAMMCAASAGVSAYMGDSGAPFMHHGVQYGFVSFGHAFDPKNNPTVFVRVDRHLSFIHTEAKAKAPDNNRKILGTSVTLSICTALLLFS